eukprot:CAMPEP_0175091004 /NCGR_PEP_ID=MMETSP0086_2-20121207/1665_1 /TAXON_ID=136419 /ORGANISM="Unknown Unknown, Strain D1" /LENGTH=427 /DNA_ID=CAMNT_0016363705 /DNA_START=149 /DNA_END=1433 /DNA_ORIENTATION=+
MDMLESLGKSSDNLLGEEKDRSGPAPQPSAPSSSAAGSAKPNSSNKPNSLNFSVSNLYTERKRNENEIFFDRCQAAFYVLDNSGSMHTPDGKIFVQCNDGRLVKKSHVTRWEELCNVVQRVAKYNLRRGMKAAYYLLNPSTDAWVEDRDFVVIDPGNDNCETKLTFLLHTMLSNSQIRGCTPLHKITTFFTKQLATNQQNQHTPINYNVITDGVPDSREQFESALRVLTSKYHTFLTVNLCTDDDSVVDYYNDLDQKLGSELSGMDVLDDLQSEQIEIKKLGTVFFVYTLDIHTARQAGCYSQMADLLDETTLPLHFVNQLCKELTGHKDLMPRINDPEYCDFLTRYNKQVFDVSSGSMKPSLDVGKIRNIIWRANTGQEISDYFQRSGLNISPGVLGLTFKVVLFLMFLWFVGYGGSPSAATTVRR